MYMINFFHFGIHVYSGLVAAAVTRAVPHSTKLGSMLEPGTLLNVHGLLLGLAGIHSDHGSIFSDGFYASNISLVREVTAELALLFYSSELSTSIGCPPEDAGALCRHAWWAGGLTRFAKPIEAFGGEIAAVVHTREKQYAKILDSELGLVGFRGPALTCKTGLATFFTNLIFIQSVMHSSSVATREAISPFGLFPSTVPFWPMLLDSATEQMNLAQVVETVYAYPTPGMIRSIGLAFAVAQGSGPQLGDGPYNNIENDEALTAAVSHLREDLATVLQQCEAFSGPLQYGRLKPAWYWKRSTPKPYGYSLMATAYV